MPFWCCRTDVNREHIAERFLRMAGYEVYCPRIRERGRAWPLFPAYCFITAALQWYRARWSIGVVALLAGASGEPAIVTDAIVMDLRNREGKDGLIRLPPAQAGRSGAYYQGTAVRTRWALCRHARSRARRRSVECARQGRVAQGECRGSGVL